MDRPRKRELADEPECDDSLSPRSRLCSPARKQQRREGKAFPSPWQLTWIRDLPEELNRDAVSLKDLLGDPLIRECWNFNYLHDIPFLMEAFDADTRHAVQVHVVHGFWQREDPRRLALSQGASEFSNVHLHVAPMPEMFGTHHSKMMILFRRDDSAQVVIHTANMISKDWTNMTNAVWRSPLLPKLTPPGSSNQGSPSGEHGSGGKFKSDLLGYLRKYDRRTVTCRPLADELARFDFSAIRAALIASAPGRHSADDVSEMALGWAALRRCLRFVPCTKTDGKTKGSSEIVVQVSSIATLGAKDDWLQKTLFESLATCSQKGSTRPRFKVVFPTADEIRRSLDGYASGASIHTKIQSQQQAKQLQYLRPLLHHWANDSEHGMDMGGGKERNDGRSSQESTAADACRKRASPHIKTYIRYNSQGLVDWALLTSANLSKQAWGEAAKGSGEMRIASWEIGVLVWPGLYGEEGVMVGTFSSDRPAESEDGKAVVGVRVPYGIPLQRYGPDEVPWVATMDHGKPDRWGRTWEA
ncbi:hypothetical protein RJ55_08170 [Drechmeria coniospora]|nr:hypothetical protein RJ55_08170 [Drechmeria coniospora]